MHIIQRGFFCADLTLRHPYRECTITVPMLLVLMLLLPMLFIAVVEIMRICKNFRMQKYARNLWRSEGTFSFGFIATYLTTELAKNAVGRLRPHFYTACQPRLPDGSSCADHGEAGGIGGTAGGIYVEQYYCSNRNLTTRQIRELHVSFPSAHSSLSFYAMLFLAFYLHAVWKGRGTCRVLRHILQFLFILLAWFISLSRVADYWHHWSDVLAGGIMGVLYAILTATYVGGMLEKHFDGGQNIFHDCRLANVTTTTSTMALKGGKRSVGGGGVAQRRNNNAMQREQLMQGNAIGSSSGCGCGGGGGVNEQTAGILLASSESDYKLQQVLTA